MAKQSEVPSGTQMEIPGTEPSERQRLENLVNVAVHDVLELETKLRNAKVAERRARAELGALSRG